MHVRSGAQCFAIAFEMLVFMVRSQCTYYTNDGTCVSHLSHLCNVKKSSPNSLRAVNHGHIIYIYCFIDFVLVNSGINRSSWTSASFYCENVIGSQLGTIDNIAAIASYESLAASHSLDSDACWIGCHQYMAQSNSRWYWESSPNDTFVETDPFYDAYAQFDNSNQRCCYIDPLENKVIQDWYCYEENNWISSNVSYNYSEQHDWTANWSNWSNFSNYSSNSLPAYCWVCDTPDKKFYTIKIKTDSDNVTTTGNGTTQTLYFRIKGNIFENSDSNDGYTDWFSVNDFTKFKTDYNWTQELDFVGYPVEITIFSQKNDRFSLAAIGVDDEYFDFGTSSVFEYNNGM